MREGNEWGYRDVGGSDKVSKLNKGGRLWIKLIYWIYSVLFFNCLASTNVLKLIGSFLKCSSNSSFSWSALNQLAGNWREAESKREANNKLCTHCYLKNSGVRVLIFFFFCFTHINGSIMKYGLLITKVHLSLDKAIWEEQCSTTPNCIWLKVKMWQDSWYEVIWEGGDKVVAHKQQESTHLSTCHK